MHQSTHLPAELKQRYIINSNWKFQPGFSGTSIIVIVMLMIFSHCRLTPSPVLCSAPLQIFQWHNSSRLLTNIGKNVSIRPCLLDGTMCISKTSLKVAKWNTALGGGGRYYHENRKMGGRPLKVLMNISIDWKSIQAPSESRRTSRVTLYKPRTTEALDECSTRAFESPSLDAKYEWGFQWQKSWNLLELEVGQVTRT